MRPLLIATVVALTGGALFSLMGGEEGSPAEATEDNELLQLRKRLARLEGKVAMGRSHTVHREVIEHRVEDPVDERDPDDEDTEPQDPDPQQQEFDPEDERDRIREEVERIDEAIDEDPVDSDWAPAMEATLDESIRDHVGELGMSLDMVECRSQFCRVKMHFDAADEPGQFMDRVAGADGFRMAGEARVEFDESGIGSTTHIFLARDVPDFPDFRPPA